MKKYSSNDSFENKKSVKNEKPAEVERVPDAFDKKLFLKLNDLRDRPLMDRDIVHEYVDEVRGYLEDRPGAGEQMFNYVKSTFESSKTRFVQFQDGKHHEERLGELYSKEPKRSLKNKEAQHLLWAAQCLYLYNPVESSKPFESYDLVQAFNNTHEALVFHEEVVGPDAPLSYSDLKENPKYNDSFAGASLNALVGSGLLNYDEYRSELTGKEVEDFPEDPDIEDRMFSMMEENTSFYSCKDTPLDWQRGVDCYYRIGGIPITVDLSLREKNPNEVRAHVLLQGGLVNSSVASLESAQGREAQLRFQEDMTRLSIGIFAAFEEHYPLGYDHFLKGEFPFSRHRSARNTSIIVKTVEEEPDRSKAIILP